MLIRKSIRDRIAGDKKDRRKSQIAEHVNANGMGKNGMEAAGNGQPDDYSDIVLKAGNLSMRYETGDVVVDALKNVSFEVRRGEFIVVLGPSGSGKSTLLNVIGGMDRPTSGTMWYGGRMVTDSSMDQLAVYRRDVVGFVFQFFNLIPSLTARENVELAASLAGDAMKPDEALAMVGLKERAGHFPSQLSGGEQQRVSVARAIVKKPALLLCDEPTGALDSKNSIAVVKLLLEVRDKLGCPVLTITHNPEMARVADRVFHMKDGELVRAEVNETPCGAEELDW